MAMTDGDSPSLTMEAARSDLVDALRSELIGPAAGEAEELTQRPTSRYLLGRLAPPDTKVDPDEDDGSGEAGSDGDDADAGHASPITMAMNPSSIGVSFVVAPHCGPLTVTARWGYYEKVQRIETSDGTDLTSMDAGELPDGEEVVVEDGDGARGQGRTRKRTYHVRTQQHHEVTFDPEADRQEPVDVSGDGVCVEFLVRRRPEGGSAVSVFLVNRREFPAGERLPEDALWLFQPEISVRVTDGTAVFAARGLEDIDVEGDPEALSNELLYWDRPEFAAGHGCAAEWEAEPGARLASVVGTEMVPHWELARIDPREGVDAELDMWALGGSGDAGVPGQRLREMLQPLADAYLRWIEETLEGQMLSAVAPELRDRAEEHIERCRISQERIVEGIELIANGPTEVRLAFCFANRAMALQRERSEISLARRRGERLDNPRTPRWRPFQIAFVLLNLPALADRRHPDRDIADLLWFPTGGGKTEAYLGLTAFALAHRRLRAPIEDHSNEAGVSVLMRYTLRLLTIQQFQRATTLICACEHLRRDEGVWGDEPFSIGLWVGRAATPNRYSDERDNSPGAKQLLQKLETLKEGDKAPAGKGSPVQLLTCPWCGAELRVHEGRADYVRDDDRELVRIFCPDDDCEFGITSDGIPAHTVDQQIYRHVPSLVIATVDKFAQMPFNGRVQALFGRVSRWCPRHGYLSNGEGADHTATTHRASSAMPKAKVVAVPPFEPPDLIIQDELHLISGPLGSLVGAYETAVDNLASAPVDGDLLPPKIVASTATIRRADRQVGSLFDRKLQIFPPSGLRSTDSWFGREVSLDEAPGRLYVGVYAPGKSVKTALVRVYAALLARAQALLARDPDVADPYMTLVGYFNSLRELGGALRLVEDDIPGRMNVLRKRDRDQWPRRYLNVREELTSNKKAEEVPQILGMLERVFTGEKPPPGRYPVDTLLASNMISVGVDVDRLGLMVVNGQPKTTAEYIQATSRVGRQSPGLVVTVYNWTRPRDTSHYERFRSYHGSLYRFVEATSVTPFSSRARDKALEGVLASMIRLGDYEMTPEQHADHLDRHSGHVTSVIEAIRGRAARVATYTGEEGPDVGATTEDELTQDLDNWEKSYAGDVHLSWTKYGMGVRKKDEPPDPTKAFLVQSQEDEGGPGGTFHAPGSLREVEGEIHVYLTDVGVDDAQDGAAS